jgi:hypothetical protein
MLGLCEIAVQMMLGETMGMCGSIFGGCTELLCGTGFGLTSGALACINPLLECTRILIG